MAKFRVRLVSAGFSASNYRRDKAMGLLLVLFWYAAVARAVLWHNSHDSRLRGFNSRIGTKKYPFSRLRELPGSGLIDSAFPRVETALFEDNDEIPRFDGIAGNF